MSKTKREPVKTSNVIHCIECNLDFDCTKGQDAFKKHLESVHKINELKGTRRMLMHMDGDTWFSWKYEWDIAGKKFIQNTIQPRSREDQAFWDAASDE